METAEKPRVEETLDDRLEAYREVCAKIIELATEAARFPASGLAKGKMDLIVGYARRAHVISGHRMSMGSTFMDMPEANIFRFSEPMQLEYYNSNVAPVRGRNSPLYPREEG